MAASPELHDARRPVDRLLGNYSDDHRNATNRVIHWICVPLIVWTVVAVLWVLPVPTVARPGLWAGLAGVAARPHRGASLAVGPLGARLVKSA